MFWLWDIGFASKNFGIIGTTRIIGQSFDFVSTSMTILFRFFPISCKSDFISISPFAFCFSLTSLSDQNPTVFGQSVWIFMHWLTGKMCFLVGLVIGTRLFPFSPSFGSWTISTIFRFSLSRPWTVSTVVKPPLSRDWTVSTGLFSYYVPGCWTPSTFGLLGADMNSRALVILLVPQNWLDVLVEKREKIFVTSVILLTYCLVLHVLFDDALENIPHLLHLLFRKGFLTFKHWVEEGENFVHESIL